MNRMHRRWCSSEKWAAIVRDEQLPRDLAGVELGDEVLEIGPGPGMTTEVLSSRALRLTVIELDPDFAESLRVKMAGRAVEVVNADATNMPFEDGRFSAAVSFSMLHHVPTKELQDRLFSEARRVLRPGGVFVGSDSSPPRRYVRFRLMHIGDTMNLLDPSTLEARLERAGFHSIEVRRPTVPRVWWRGTA